MDLETIEGLLQKLEASFEKKDRNIEAIDNYYKKENGHILSKEYDEYKERREKIFSSFTSEATDCLNKLDALCKRVRKKQPVLSELQAANINLSGRFPRRIALGKYHIEGEQLDFYVPKMFEFPLKKPMYICEDEQMDLLHKVILRLMYSLPADKQEYYIFDPIGLGKSMWIFNRLFENEKLFPQKKIMTSNTELKEALKTVSDYMQNLYSNTFDLQTDCPDWDSYNRRLFSQHNIAKMLPYKVFIFMDVPDGMDSECFEMFRKLLLHSEECGFLVLFSFNEVLLEAEDSKMRAQELLLRQCIENSVPLHSVFDLEHSNFSLNRFSVKSIGEKFPDDRMLDKLLSDFDEFVSNTNNTMFSFNDMLAGEKLFSSNSANGLVVPCGYASTGDTEIELNIGDRYTHYLIGGTTGSGKSNLLHNIIMSACWNYSPDELRIYLLDFKQGVEFSRYVKPLLKQAVLVATEADTEYGISVLKHLSEEMVSRYLAFKKANCKNIQEYRKENPCNPMPRIMVVIDEFQLLFEGEHKDSTIETLDVLARQGRACGIHLIMATQSISHLEFGALGTQFNGRIALKCSADDSRSLLGGATCNNEAASGIEIPYAILNTSQGAVSGNVKYAVPEAKTEIIGEKLMLMEQECQRQRIETSTKIFDGQKFPIFPNPEEFYCAEGIQLLLGETLDYDANKLRICLEDSLENNVIICGHDNSMKKSFIDSVALSAAGCDEVEELIYIGDSKIDNGSCGGKTVGVTNYNNLRAFIAAHSKDYYSKKRIIMFDNVNFGKEIGFPVSTYPAPSEETKAFKEYWDEANRHGTHFVALYEGMNRLKACNVPLIDFKYRIGYSLNADEKNQFLNNSTYLSKAPKKRRAFLAENLVVEAWFRTFEES